MGVIGAAQRLANLLAFALASLLVAQLSQERFRLAIALTAAMVFVGWLFSLTLREADAQVDGESSGSLDLVQAGWAALRSNVLLRRLALLAVATLPFRDYLLNLYPPRFVAVGLPSIWLGLGLSLASLLGILAARYAYLLPAHLGARSSLLWVTALPGLLYLVFAVALRPGMALLTFCLLLGSMSLKEPIFADHLNRHIASRHRATLLSLINMASGLYVALMGLLIGRIADLSLTAAFLFMGGLVLAGTLWFRVD